EAPTPGEARGPLVPGRVRVPGELDAADLRVVGQELDDLAGVVVVPLDAQAQGLDALEQQEGVERADGRADVAQQLDPGLDDVGARAERLPVLQAVVAGV